MATGRFDMMTIDWSNDDIEQHEESGQEVGLTPEMELALGRVLLPVFARYLQERGFLKETEFNETLEEESGDEMSIEETVNRIAGAQLGHTYRLSRIEEGYQQIAVAIQQLTQIASSNAGRIEGEIVALNRHFERIDAILERVVELQIENASQIKSLIEAQSRTEERIQSQRETNGSTPKPRAKRTVKKTVKKDPPE